MQNVKARRQILVISVEIHIYYVLRLELKFTGPLEVLQAFSQQYYKTLSEVPDKC